MKLDYDLVKEILTDIESNTDGSGYYLFDYSFFCEDKLGLKPGYINEMSQLELDSSQPLEKERHENFLKYSYHYKLLIDGGFINGNSQYQDPTYKGLTWEGHQLLDAMRNDTVLNKIKETTTLVGFETLKQLPALAVKVIMGVL